MRITKIYETILNISASDMYGDLDSIIMDQLRQKFEGKCERGALVVKVLEIFSRSNCNVSNSRLDGSGDVCVQFKVEAIVYYRGEVLVGCEIQKVERSNKILCKHQKAVIDVKGDRSVQRLKRGQHISILVTESRYLKGHENINVYGVPYSYSLEFLLYYVNFKDFDVNKNGEKLELIKQKLDQIAEETQKYKKASKEVKFFNDILYPFKSKAEKDPKSFSQINLLDLAKKLANGKFPANSVFLMKHPRLRKEEPKIYEIKPKFFEGGMKTNHLLDPQVFNIKLVEENAAIVILQYLNEYLHHLIAVQEMAQIYKTDTDRKKHSNLWAMYKLRKM